MNDLDSLQLHEKLSIDSKTDVMRIHEGYMYIFYEFEYDYHTDLTVKIVVHTQVI